MARRTRAFYAAALTIVIVGCCPPPRVDMGKPVPVAEIPYSVSPMEAYGRILRAVVDANLAIELKDADGGVVQTEWHTSGLEQISVMHGYIRRRVRFQILIESGKARVKPQAEHKYEGPHGTWLLSEGFSDFEEAAHKALVTKLTDRLSAP